MEKIIKSIIRTPEDTTVEELLNSSHPGQTVELLYKPVAFRNPETPIKTTQQSATPSALLLNRRYAIKVRKYMTQSSSPDFNFMQTFNNNIPMPFRVMVGKAIRETRGMFYMELHAEPLPVSHCMKCGRTLTHPVSRLYGLGPECGSHFHINPFESEEELDNALEEVQNKLRAITWEGWVIKSAIENFKEV